MKELKAKPRLKTEIVIMMQQLRDRIMVWKAEGFGKKSHSYATMPPLPTKFHMGYPKNEPRLAWSEVCVRQNTKLKMLTFDTTSSKFRHWARLKVISTPKPQAGWSLPVRCLTLYLCLFSVTKPQCILIHTLHC